MQHSLTVDGVTIQYWVYNPKATTTVVIVHGFTGSHEGFQYITPSLSSLRLVIPDLPGFGASDLPEREHWSIDALAQLANRFVAELRLASPPHLFGHSMGGLVASSMLAQAKTGLFHEKAVLLSPVPTAIRRNDRRRPGAILGALQYRIGHRAGKAGEKLVKSRQISRALSRFIMTTTDRQLRREIYQHHFKNLDHISSIEYYSQLYTDINRRGSIDYAEKLCRYQILLITGSSDTVTPLAEQKKFAEAVSPATFTILPGAGHLTHYERADEVADEINRFIGKAS